MVLLACLIRDFLIPLLVWNRHLRNRDYSYRFWFCIITQASLQINLVLLLGFFNICNPVTIIISNVLIYGLIIWNYSDKKFFHLCMEMGRNLWKAYKEKRFLRYLMNSIKQWLKKLMIRIRHWNIWPYIRRNWIEIALLLGLIFYNIWFLTYNVLSYHSYQFSDIPVHQSWIYGLEQGTLFSDGIYPFGMHAMIYFIRSIFRLDLREILLYAGAYQTVIMVIGLYLLARQIFKAKYSPIAVILIFSFMLNQGRYGASLPQEFGMYVAVGTAYFMIRYLHKDRKKFIIEGDSRLRSLFRINTYINRRYIDSEAILLMLSVTLVIAYHFYTAIAAIFLVVSIGLAYIPRVLKKQYFIPLMFSGLMGAIIALLPMAACLAKGIPFQESMAWATSVIAGEEWHGSDADYQDILAKAQGNNGPEDEANTDSSEAEEEREKVTIDYSSLTFREIIEKFYRAMYNFGMLAMFGASATWLMFISMAMGLIGGFIMLLVKKYRVYGNAYIALILNMTILCIIGGARELGLVELIAAARASTFAEPFIGFIYILPVDFIFRVMGLWKNRYYQSFLNFMSLILCGLAAFFIIEMGWYHNYFDVNLAYYNEPDYLLRNIRKNYDDFTYTIVSPTEEYYTVIDYGYHTQLSEFMNMVNGGQEEFTFPTKYVFFFIEKLVLQDYAYGQVRVDPKYAVMDFIYLNNSQDYYFQRAIIESQAYYWAQKMLQIYPYSFKVYYEDDIYVAYILEQNTYSPYSLQIDYLSEIKDEINNDINGDISMISMGFSACINTR